MFDPFYRQMIRKGVDGWNKWRLEHPNSHPDLNRAELDGLNLADANLSGIELHRASLCGTDLTRANLSAADLSGADLSGAYLRLANLRDASLAGAELPSANLRGADLSGALLRSVNLANADLGDTNLSRADLEYANLRLAKFDASILLETNFASAETWKTKFCDTDLSCARGLETVCHYGPSTIGMDCIVKSNGRIPEAFLKGAGLADYMVEFVKSLDGSANGQLSCFLGHSKEDCEFAVRLQADLRNAGVRCWPMPVEQLIGRKSTTGINEELRIHDKLLVVLSKNSVECERLEDEVEAVLDTETEDKTIVFAVCLDEEAIEASWVSYLARTRALGDFRNWRDPGAYTTALASLLNDLKTGSVHHKAG